MEHWKPTKCAVDNGPVIVEPCCDLCPSRAGAAPCFINRSSGLKTRRSVENEMSFCGGIGGMRQFLLGAALLIQCTTVEAQFFDYSEWQKLLPSSRAIYIAGAFDSLIGFATDESGKEVSAHYSGCVSRSRMDNSQLSKNVRKYLSSRPELHGGSVQAALVTYLVVLCGAPKGKNEAALGSSPAPRQVPIQLLHQQPTRLQRLFSSRE